MLLRDKVHLWLFYLGVSLMVIGLPLSKFLMSFSQIILIGNWVLEGNFKEKFSRLKTHPIALGLITLFVIYCIGALYSENLSQAWNEIRIKIPMALLSLIFFSTNYFDKKSSRFFKRLLILSTFISTSISLAIYHGFIDVHLKDIRDISPLISHIRLSLLVVLSTAFVFMDLIKPSTLLTRSLGSLLILWFFYFLLVMQSFTGFAILSVLFLIWLSNKFFILHRKSSWIYFSLIILGMILIGIKSRNYYNSYFSATPIADLTLPLKTKNGHFYHHYKDRKDIENGNYVWLNVCWQELKDHWKERSDMDLFDRDKKGQFLDATLIRYMTSKGLKKDKEGLDQLSDAEIVAIENGIANQRFLNETGIQLRIYKAFWQLHQYIHGANPGGNSLTQRIEYWKCSWKLIQNNFLFGVGTGDLQSSLNVIYDKHSLLDEEYWHKPHNQYLNITAILGLIGLIVFLVVLAILFKTAFQTKNFYLLVFMIIVSISFLTEDTLDTQAGISFFAFLCCFLPQME